MKTKNIKLSEHWADGRFYGYRKFIHGHHFTLGTDRSLAEDKVRWLESYWESHGKLHAKDGKWTPGDIVFAKSNIDAMGSRTPEQITADKESDLDEIGIERAGTPAEHEQLKLRATHVPQLPVSEVLTVPEAMERFMNQLRARQQAGVIKSSHATSQEYRLRAALVPLMRLSLPQVDQAMLSAAILRIVQRPMVGKPTANVKDSDGKVTKGKPKMIRMSYSYASNCLKTLRWFFEWADGDYWHCPKKVFNAAFKVSPIILDEERRQQLEEMTGVEPPTFSIDELVKLYEAAANKDYANGNDRLKLYILLCLNCGFASMEIATLKKWECKLDVARPYIQRIRQKTQKNGQIGVYAKWFLWPETVDCLRNMMNGDSSSELAVVSKNGKPLVEDTSYGRKDALIQAWEKLLVKANMPDGLSIKYLRKTSAMMIRKLGGKEFGEMLLSHSDGGQIKAYAPRDWDRLGDLLSQVRLQLQPIFSAATPNTSQAA